MGKFEVGQRIVLTNYLGTVEGLKNGAVGVLSAKNSDLDIFFAKFDGFYGEIPVYPGEMELAPAQPATGGEGGQPRTDLDAVVLEHWPRMFRERATDPMFAGLYNEAGKNDILDLLDVVATLRNELAVERAAHNVNAERMNEFEAQLARERERTAAAEAALETIARNSLEKEPTGNEAPAWTYAQAWTLWVVGEHARDALAYKARQTAGE